MRACVDCGTSVKGLRCRPCDTMERRTQSEIRFWGKVDQTGGPDDCWSWQASLRGSNDYGQFTSGGRPIAAHRFAWQAVNGPIPAGLFVLHRCDNPPCCNPGHLFLGTHSDNMDDRRVKGHNERIGRAGERNSQAKLTAAQVIEIRALAAAGVPQKEVAARFGVTWFHVRSIVNRHRWAWL